MSQLNIAGRKVNTEDLAELAADLVGRHVTVIVAPGGAPAALAAKSATTTPIVFEMGADHIRNWTGRQP